MKVTWSLVRFYASRSDDLGYQPPPTPSWLYLNLPYWHYCSLRDSRTLFPSDRGTPFDLAYAEISQP